MTLKTKLWVGVGAFVMAGTQIDLSNGLGGLNIRFGDAHAATAKHSEGGEGGEGGESGEVRKNAAQRKIEFLKLLSLVEGHLTVGNALYKEGAIDAAITHMKHPSDELYAKLKPGFKAYHAKNFASSLEKMAAAVQQKKSVEEVERAFQTVLADIDIARQRAPADVKTQLVVASQLVNEASADYAEGVKNGKVVNAHEYQDAYGFVNAATRLVDNIKPKGAAQEAAVGKAKQALSELKPAWPSLAGTAPVATASSLLYGAASRIELAASSL